MSDAIYLDYNATAPVRPEVIDAMSKALASVGNPSSVHVFGRAARAAIEDARERVAALVGVGEPEAVTFTSGGSEANATVIRGCGRRRVLVSAVEHSSVLNNAMAADVIAVTSDGALDLDELVAVLREDDTPALVCVMVANNETGVLQPIVQISDICHNHGAWLHVDAIQGAGKIPIEFDAWGVDSMSLSAHKIGGPQGVGALIVRPGAGIEPMILGGGQERRRRAGTENVAGIVGFGRAADLARLDLPEMFRLGEMRDRLEIGAREIWPELRIMGGGQARLPNTSNLLLPWVRSDKVVIALDLEGVAISSGSACSSGKVSPSHVLDAMGLAPEEAVCAVRISLGWNTTEVEVAAFLDAFATVSGRLRFAASA